MICCVTHDWKIKLKSISFLAISLLFSHYYQIMYNKLCATYTQVLEVRTDSPVFHLWIFPHWSQVGPWRESQRWPKTRSRESSELSYSSCFWQNCSLKRDVITDFCGPRGACESHLLVAAEVEVHGSVLWWLRNEWEELLWSQIPLGDEIKVWFSAGLQQADETSSKIFGGWDHPEEKLIIMFLHH